MQEATTTSESLDLSQAHVKSRVSNQACFSNKQHTFDYLGSHDACGSQNPATTIDCRVTSMHTQMRFMYPSAYECALTPSHMSLGHGLRRKGCPFQSADASEVCAHMRAFACMCTHTRACMHDDPLTIFRRWRRFAPTRVNAIVFFEKHQPCRKV